MEFDAKGILLAITGVLPSSDTVTKSLSESLKSAKRLTAIFLELDRISRGHSELLMTMLDDYYKRVLSFIEYLASVEKMVQQGEETGGLVISCYDEILVIYLLAFSIYDRFYDYVFETAFRNFLIKNELIERKYGDLELRDITRRRTLFDQYNFPIVFGMFLNRQKEFKELFARSLNLSDVECEKEVKTFTKSFIYLMGMRNQIAHMAEKLELYSIQSEKMKTKAKMLVSHFSTFQSDLERLLKFFFSMTKQLKNEGILKKTNGKAQSKVVERLLLRLSAKISEMEDPNEILETIKMALEKARKTRTVNIEDLFEP